MPLSAIGPTALEPAECRRLLAGESLGRVILSVDALPAAFPVNYRLVGNAIVFQTAAGTKLTSALTGTVVGFEVDQVDSASRSGWSVLVVGRSSVIVDPDELAVVRELDIPNLAGPQVLHFVRIQLERVSGRRIAPQS